MDASYDQEERARHESDMISQNLAFYERIKAAADSLPSFENDDIQNNSQQLSPSLCNTNAANEPEVYLNKPTSSLHGLLIDAIQSYECIWRVSSSSYKDKNMRQRCWMEISVALEQEVEVLKKEWDKLKDNYRKCLQRRNKLTKSGSGATAKLPVCNFFKELSFLKEVVSNRKSVSNITLVNNDTSNPPSTAGLDSPTTSGDSKSTLSAPPRSKKRKNSDGERDMELSIDAMIAKALTVEEKKENLSPLESNEDQLFCLSLVEMMKSLPNRKKRYVRMKIEELFYEVSEE